jgi:LmbE family N-acetylglucosaminyl deacetylase
VKVLAIGAHPDDIELGCGGALLAHRRRGDEVRLLVMTTGESGPQAARSRIQEQEDAAAILGASLVWGDFTDGAIPEGRDAVQAIQAVLDGFGADVVYTHSPRDTHQDHRATAHATMAAARRFSRILMYEAPTTQGFTPTVFAEIEGLVEDKLDLLRAHMSQVLKNGLVDLEAVEAQARLRGFQARVRHAEAFETDRFLWDLGASGANHHAAHATAAIDFDSEHHDAELALMRSAGSS